MLLREGSLRCRRRTDDESPMPLPRMPVYRGRCAEHVPRSCPIGGFSYTKDAPKQFKRSDLERPVTREFCAECGTHLVTRPPGFPAVIVKVGTLDDPSLFGVPQMAIYTIDKQPFHQIPDGLPTFERLPQR